MNPLKDLVENLQQRNTVFFSEHTVKVFAKKYNMYESDVRVVFQKRYNRHMNKDNSCETKIHQKIQNNYLYGFFAGRFPSITNKI